MARIFSVLGDSNVQRNMGGLSVRDRPLMASAQVIPCGRLEVLAEGLRQVRAESNVCVLSCVTNFITAAEGSTTSVSLRVEPVLRELLSIVEEEDHEPQAQERPPPAEFRYPSL